jgi:Na+/H+ antiporter NhaD/arsenite permease-like protein
MGLLPEFSVVLGTCAFSAMSLLSAQLYKDISSTLHKLSQGTAFLGISALLISQGFITGVFSWDPAYSTLFWMSIASLGAALASVVGLNVYLAAVKRRIMLASTLGGTITLLSASTSVLVIASSENTERTVSTASPYTRLTVASPLVAGFRTLGLLRQTLRPVERIRAEKTPPPPTNATLPVQASQATRGTPLSGQAILITR